MYSKIHISTSSFGKFSDESINLMKKYNITPVFNPYGRKMTVQESVNFLSEAELLLAGTELLNEEVLNTCKSLKVISRCGIGIDNIDLVTIEKLGIQLFTTKSPFNAVAEYTVSLILSSLKNLELNFNNSRNKFWKQIPSIEVVEKKIGIIGFGEIGKEVYRLLSVFSNNIFVFDPFFSVDSEEFKGIKFVNFEELTRICDIISLHLPLNSNTKNMFCNELFSKLKKDVTIINTSRGGLIVEDDLHKFLLENPKSFALLDVFNVEPYNGKLYDLKNVFISPHISSFSIKSRNNMEFEAVQNILNYIQSK